MCVYRAYLLFCKMRKDLFSVDPLTQKYVPLFLLFQHTSFDFVLIGLQRYELGLTTHNCLHFQYYVSIAFSISRLNKIKFILCKLIFRR